MPDFTIEKQFGDFVIGLDEAGRGPLAGPVSAAAVLFLDRNIDFIDLINDSKKLSKKKRESLFAQITNHPKILYHNQIIDNNIIDQINILNATKQAMQKSVLAIYQQAKIKNINITQILTDGNLLMLKDINRPDNTYPETPVIKGDSKSLSIAAASIIAKVSRDQIMQKLHSEFPYYNWQKNSGYGTKEHLDAIKKYGISSYHRKSFAPIKSAA